MSDDEGRREEAKSAHFEFVQEQLHEAYHWDYEDYDKEVSAKTCDFCAIDLILKEENQMTDAPKETRDQKFIRLANARVRKALNSIRLIGNLATYPHTSDQTKKIVSAVNTAVTDVEYRLAGSKKEETPAFDVSE